MRLPLSALVLALAFAATTRAELSGDDVMQRVAQRRVQGDDAVSVLHVALTTRGGQRTTSTVHTYRKRCGAQWNSLIVVREPPDAAGSGVLSWMHPDRPPDMWLYLPDLGRVRQLNALAQRESFLGSDLTYEDVGTSFHARAHQLTREEDIDGEPTYRIESQPTSDADPYGRILTWVSRRTFLPVRVEYHDRSATLLRIGRFGDVREVKGIPTPFDLTMENVQTGHRTEVTMREVDFDRGLDCDLFTPRRLARAP